MGFGKATENWDELGVKILGASADPAAGAEMAYTIGTGRRWLLTGIRAILVCAVAAANRLPSIRIQTDGATYDLVAASTVPQTTGLTCYWHWKTNNVVGATLGTMGAAAFMTVGLGIGGIELPAGAVITSITTDINAGDNWSVFTFIGKEEMFI